MAKFDGEHWTAYTTENSGLPDVVWALAFDAQGVLWIGTVQYGTPEAGLAKFDGEEWTVYTTGNSGLPTDDIFALTFDDQGNLWIGTGHPFGSGRGLVRFDGEHWTVYDTSNSGLPHNTVCSLAFDVQGNLWIGTGGGLAVYREGGVISEVTAVGMSDKAEVPSAFSLSQNYPNPFNPRTTIAYYLPQASDVTVTVHTITGQKVATVVSGHQEAGHYEVVWDDHGCASGIYLYHLKTGRFEQTKRMVLLR